MPPPAPTAMEPQMMPVPQPQPQAQPQPQPQPLPIEAAALRMRLGNPDFVRREMETELWRYDMPRCAVFFFMQQENGILRVRYTETLPRGMNMAVDPACLSELAQRTGAGAPMLMSAPGAPP